MANQMPLIYNNAELNLSVDNINSIEALRIPTLSLLISFSSPYHRIWVITTSDLSKMLLLMTLILFKRVSLWLVKFWQWRKKWMVDSTADPHVHRGFIQHWKLCWNLCSFNWPKLRRSLVNNLTPFGLKISKMLFGDVFEAFKIKFLNIWKEDELFILFSSSLFHAAVNGKKEFLNKLVLYLKLGIWSEDQKL